MVLWKVDFYQKQGSVVDRISCFHIYKTCSRACECKGDPMPVRVDLIFVDSSFLVVFKIVQTDVERSVGRSDPASDMYFLADVSPDVVGRVLFHQSRADLVQITLVYPPSVFADPVVFRADRNLIVAVPFYVQIVPVGTQIEPVFKRSVVAYPCGGGIIEIQF